MKLLYVTSSEKKVKEFKEIIKKQVDVTTVDSLFDLEQNAIKKAQNVWKKEKDNYDYIIADEYGLFSEFAPNILGIESETWWPGTQRDRSEALVNLFNGVRDREIYYKSVFVAIGKSGGPKVAEGYTYGYLAKKVKERNGEGYDSVFIADDGKYLSHHTPQEIIKLSARTDAIKSLAEKL